MVYRLLADFTVMAHFAFVLLVILGGLLVVRRRSVMCLHLPAVAWGVVIEWTGWTCPLTPLENWLRHLGEEAGYTGGFIEYYVTAILYPEGLTRESQRLFALVALAVNFVIYWRVLFRPRSVMS